MLERKARSIGQEGQDSLQSFSNETYPSSKVHDTLGPSNYPVTQAQVFSGDSYASMMRTSNYVCTDCGKKYKWLDSLKRHQRVDCGNKEKKFSCHVCDRKFKYRYELRNHISAHHRGWLSYPYRAWFVRTSWRINRGWPDMNLVSRRCSKYLWLRLEPIELISYRHDADRGRLFEK